MIKIRRRKPIFEDDQNTQQQQQPATNTQQPATQAPAAQPQQNTTAPQQPTNNQQPNQTQDQNNNQQQQDQNNQQQQQQPNPNAQKVQDTLKQMENTWWMISVNLPDEIQKNIPDFKQGNQQADPAIKAWNDFKQNPSEDTFKNFLNGFKSFGGLSGDQNANNNQQPQQNNGTTTQQQPANNTQQPNQQPQQNVNAGLKAAYSFRKNLMENLAIAKQKQYYNTVCEDYFDKNEFTL